MTTSGDSYRPELAPSLVTLLASLRQRIRRYVWLEGTAAAVAWLGMVFWSTLGIDWFFEPPVSARLAVLAGATLVLVWIVFDLIVRRLVVPLPDRSMALLLERTFPQFQERLLTAVELTGGRDLPPDCNPAMLDDVCRAVAEPTEPVRLRRVFNFWPLRRKVAMAVVLAASAVAFIRLLPVEAAVWARRTLLLSEELWPRRTWLEVEGFDKGVVKIARGGDLDVSARVDLGRSLLVPQTVEVRYQTASGAKDRKPMSREGQADPSRDVFQYYSYAFRNVLTPLTFDVFGGDAAVRELRIDVVDSPTIVGMIFRCEYPAYTGREPDTAPMTSLMQFPRGSRIGIVARTNKELVSIDVDEVEDTPRPPVQIEPSGPKSFAYTLEKLDKDTTLLFTLLDTDGIKSREPVRVVLSVLEDHKPEFTAQLRGIGSAITAEASIPVTGRVIDDYGLARVWFEYGIDPQKPEKQSIATLPGNPTEFLLNHALDVRPQQLKPGQKFFVSLKAEDRCNLDKQSNRGESERWQLDVVTPDQLLLMLQARELVLRQRFESVLHDVQETRDSLSHVEFGDKDTPSDKKPSDDEVRKDSKRAAARGAEPGDKSEAPTNTAERLLGQRTVRVEWAAQHTRKDVQELSGIVGAFVDIREELINNRLDTEELKARLQGGVIDPLRLVVAEMFPELDRRLDRLQAVLADPQAGPARRDAAMEQVDAILHSMRQVLSRMIELEDFNQAIELLRSILNGHRDVMEQTKKRHKDKLRDLMEK